MTIELYSVVVGDGSEIVGAAGVVDVIVVLVVTAVLAWPALEPPS